MKEKSKLLEIRNKSKKKKPKFLRQSFYKTRRLKKVWRRPSGIHSKMREKHKGKRRQPSVGFSSPRIVRGLTREGFERIIIKNVKELSEVKIPFYVSGSVGLKKKLDILRKAIQMKLKVLNVKDADKFITDTEARLKSKREKKTEKQQEKKKAQEEAARKAEEKKKEETAEEKEKREKEEKKKVLEGKT